MAQTIEITRGTSNTFHINVKDVNGNAYTLAEGEKLLFGVKYSPEDKDTAIVKVCTASANGGYEVKLAPADTADLKYGRFFYDVGLQSGEDYFNVIPTSPFIISPSVTKWGDGA